MGNVMSANQNLDVDSEIVGVAQDLDDAARGALALFAIIENFRCDDQPV